MYGSKILSIKACEQKLHGKKLKKNSEKNESFDSKHFWNWKQILGVNKVPQNSRFFKFFLVEI